MDDCISIETFRQKITDAVNNCGLSVGTAYYTLKDIFNEVTKLYQQTLQEEQEKVANNTQFEDANVVVGSPYQEGMDKETIILGGENNE